MLILAGLGNPGPAYAGNRHNIGFMAIDALARRHGFSPFRQKFNGELTEGKIAGHRVLLFKPQTYMNLSGQPIGDVMRFYKLPPEALTVFHDELDLPLGKLRVKFAGGHGGHNGLKSIDAHLGPDYRRIRLGIGHPGDKERVTSHVLSDFSAEEMKAVEAQLAAAAEHAPLLLAGDEAGFMNKVTLALQPATPSSTPNQPLID